MGRLVERQETGVQLQLSLEVVTTIKTKEQTFNSSYEEEAAAMESELSWKLTNANHPSISIFFCTDIKSLCEALISSYPRTFSIHNSISSISSSSSSNGFLAILPFQVTISLTKQPKKPPPFPQTQFFLFSYPVLFKSLTRQFMMLHQYMNGLLLCTNIK